MKILPTLASDMRGSIAGVTASKNRGGNYFRARRVPSKPNTSAQQSIRTALSSLSSYWSTVLTAAQMASWNLYGKTNPVKNNLGQTIILSGSQMFNRLNVPIVASQGQSAIVATSPGAVPFLAAPQFGSATVVSVASGISAVVNFAANLTVGDLLFLYITRPNSVGKVPSHSSLLSWTSTQGDNNGSRYEDHHLDTDRPVHRAANRIQQHAKSCVDLRVKPVSVRTLDGRHDDLGKMKILPTLASQMSGSLWPA